MTKEELFYSGHKNLVISDSHSEKYMEYRKKFDTNPLTFTVESAPIHVDLELNTTCNLNCPMCFHSYAKPEPIIMDFSLAKRIIKECAEIGVYSMKLQIRGEPLLYPRLVELISYAKELGIIEVMINTNGTLLNTSFSKELIKAKLDKIIIGVESPTKEIYESIREGADYDNVSSNILGLMALKDLLGVSKPIVYLQWVEHPENKGREDEFIRFWTDRVDEMGMNSYIDYDPEKDNTELDSWNCEQLWQRLLILADGDIIPCCGGYKGGGKIRYKIGDIYNNSLLDIWHGHTLNLLRDLHKLGKSHLADMCVKCGIRQEYIKQKTNIK